MRKSIFVLSMALGLGGFAAAAQGDDHVQASAQGAKASILSPANGAAVSSPVLVQFGLDGMAVAPAGTEQENSGHHHLIVDADLPPLDDYIPSGEDAYRHFGKGQIEVSLELEPGEHTLQLLLGDLNHLAHNPPVYSEQITITVE